MAEPYLGQIIPFGGNFAIRGWAKCDGQLLSINSNQALFSILGTTYGGDGRTTFGLPDLRGRTCIHEGSGPGLQTYRLGQRSGVETVTLTNSQIPSHTHALRGTTDVGTTANPTNAHLATVSNNTAFPPAPEALIYNPSNSNLTNLASGSVANDGGNQNHTNLSPYLAVTWLIATQGLFPSRN